MSPQCEVHGDAGFLHLIWEDEERQILPESCSSVATEPLSLVSLMFLLPSLLPPLCRALF